MEKGTIWRNIDDLVLWERNPNEGDIGSIVTSIKNNGYNDTCHEWNGIIKGGNHSIMALHALRKEGWHPDKCAVDSTCLDIVNGEWLASIVNISHMNDMQSDAFALAINRTQRLGNDDPVKLAELLQDIFASNEVASDATGYTGDELDELLRDLEFDNPNEKYSRKIESPHYEPSGEKPSLVELFNNERTNELIREIEQSDLPDNEKEFLKIAAQRHTVLNFSKIADYYAHSDSKTQRLMENSALVIIDFERAIELGFVRLTERIAGLVGQEYVTK